MPAFRDFAQNYNSSTSALHMTCAVPAFAQNDLLIAPVSTDSGTQSYAGLEDVTAFWWSKTGGTVYADITTAANDVTTGDVYMTDVAGAGAINDACYWGHSSRFNAVGITVSTAAVGTQTWVWEYYNGSVWGTLTTLTNNITTTAAAGMRLATFNPPSDWGAVSPNSGSMPTIYWIRRRTSAWTSTTTRGLNTQAYVGKWLQLYSATNTVNQGVMFKIAGATEGSSAATDFAFGFTTAETANVAVLSIRDVDTAIPLATEVNNGAAAAGGQYGTANQDSSQAVGNGTITGVSQSFTALAGRLASVTLYLKKTGSPTGNATVKLYTHTGTFGTSSTPTAVALALSNTLDVSTLTTGYTLVQFTFPWYAMYALTATNYVVSLEYSAGDSSNYVQAGYDASSPTHSGNKATLSGTWSAQAGEDLCFYLYTFTYNTGTAAAARSALPTMTTSRDNSLVMWVAANAGTSTSTLYLTAILEGPCTYLYGKDGTAHSDALSWGWQKSAGTTASTVYQTNLGTGTQTISTGVIAINPPSTGATVIPAYPVSDASVYISPMTGAAYNGDTAPVNTITSAFGSTLNGKTLAAGGTTYTRADSGLNSFHAAANVLGVATANQWNGVRLTFASAKDLSNKNVLLHMQTYLPVSMQTTDSVQLTGCMGVAVGFGSVANTNYKMYHVAGAGWSWGIGRHAPVIIHPTYAGAGLIQNSGTLNAASVVELGVAVSQKVVATNWLFMSMWALDTTVVAGGNAAEPLNLAGMVRAAADGYERRSVILQGASQMMILQPLQIGDGATNPVYLNLDATAIEFPRQYDKASGNTSYLSVDNFCGLIYYPGSGDTITHKNSVVSSQSRYKWGLHTSASTSAYYDFSGLSVIGAGTVTLGKAITLTGMTINDYSTLDMTGLTLTYSTIKGTPAASGSATVTSSTNIDYCTITVTGVTAGNYWTTIGDPTIFTYCAFTGSGSTGHAIRITTPGTYSFVGNTFTSFGADGTNFAAIYNDSGGLVTLNISGGGSTPTVRNGASATTVVQNAVTVTVTVKDASTLAAIENARVLLEKVSDGTDILPPTSLTNSSGVVTASYAYTGDTAVTGTARRASAAYGTLYKPGAISGTITSAGLDVTILLNSDE